MYTFLGKLMNIPFKRTLYRLLQNYFDETANFSKLEIKDNAIVFKGYNVSLSEVLSDLSIGYTIYDISTDTKVPVDVLAHTLTDFAKALDALDKGTLTWENLKFKEVKTKVYDTIIHKLGP